VLWALIGKHKPNFKNLKKDVDFLVASGIFIIMHVVAMSQIIYPTRLVLPAYIFAAVIFCYIIWKLFCDVKNSRMIVGFLSVISIVLIIGVIGLRSYFAITYYNKVSPILDEIKNSEAETYCVKLEDATAKRIPYIHMAQEDFLVDWAMPQTIYGKKVFYCE
jgi:hypothetical protein